MAFPLFPSLIQFIFFTFFFTILAQAQVPTNKTFKFINQGEFGEYITEYGADYRVIRTDGYSFYKFPFRLCFYNTTPDAHIFAIRLGIPNDEGIMRWVWDANRNNPVGENATLTFGRNGNLVLADADGHVAWQTNTANKGVTGIELLPNGNLVLHDKKGKFIWQSFDHPTDTLLVGQSVKMNGVNKLVSRTSNVDGSDGKYIIVLEKIGFNMYIKNSGKLLIYGGWRGTYLGSIVTFDAVPENDNATAYELVLTINQDPQPPSRRRLLQRPIRSGGQLNLNKLNYNATYSYLRLDYNGNLKAYTYYDKVSYLRVEESFAFFSSYFVRECALPSKCGEYGLCNRGMCVACPNPKGLLGWSESCSPPKKLAKPCISGGGGGGDEKVKYYKIVGVDHFLGTYLDEESEPVKVEKCRERCDKDCKCLGFFYKENTSKCLLAPLLGTLIKDANNTSLGYIKY